MLSPEPELVWQGRIQLGDEPGTFADASYSGLSAEFPLTVRNTGATSANDTLSLFLSTENVKVFLGYPGHKVSIFYYKETATPRQWSQNLYKTFRLQNSQPLQMDIDLSSFKPPDPKKNIYISVSIEVDTTVAPGLYNDFVVTTIKATSDQYKYVANLGFDYY